MLGELILEEKSKTTGVRVLPDGKVEQAAQGSGKAWGVEYDSVETFTTTFRPDGTQWFEGQGIAMTKEGDVVTFKGSGLGWSTGRGWSSAGRGAIYFQTASPKFAKANKTVGVFEFESDAEGNGHVKIWEWK